MLKSPLFWITSCLLLLRLRIRMVHCLFHRQVAHPNAFCWVHFRLTQCSVGYEFSRTPGNRWWRKNRRRNANGSFGVDLNRNFDEHFGVVGTSSNPSSDTYRGPSAFSEPETKALTDFVLTLPNRTRWLMQL